MVFVGERICGIDGVDGSEKEDRSVRMPNDAWANN